MYPTGDIPRQGEMDENTPFTSKLDKRSVNDVGTDWRVMTKTLVQSEKQYCVIGTFTITKVP